MMYNFLMQGGNFDVIIIGSGPAGLTAAIYTSRAALKTLVIAGDPPGGQLTTTTEVENFPGFPEGITGPELILKLRSQATKFGCVIVDENVNSVSENHEKLFKVDTRTGKKYHADSVIIATGATAKWLQLDSEQRLRGKGVSACATCDGFFFKNKVVAVVGGGDASMEEATYLTKFATKVLVLVRGDKDKMKASKIMQQRAFENPKIEFLFNTSVEEVMGENSVKGLKVKNRLTEKVSEIPDIEGLFIAIGHEPNTGFLAGFVELDEKGYVKITDGTKTSKNGVFVAGDVADYRYRQAISAAGLGCMAAIDATRFLSEHATKNKSVSN